MADIQHEDVTSVHRGGYRGTSDPGAVGADVFWTDTNFSPPILRIRNTTNTAWVRVGQIVTVSSLGVGAEVCKHKVGEDIEFRRVRSPSGTLAITHDSDNVNLEISPAGIQPIVYEINGYFTSSYLLTQFGTGHPTAVPIVEQGIGNVSWERADTGIYLGTPFVGSLPVGLTMIHTTYGFNTSDINTDGVLVHAFRNVSGQIEINSFSLGGTFADLYCDNLAITVIYQYSP